jgi:hypothetical protein
LLQGVTDLAKVLAQAAPNASLATNNVGILAYESRLHIIDMLGLNDRHIARAPGKHLGIPGHGSHDGAYVLERNPDMIFLSMPQVIDKPLKGSGVRPFYPPDFDLLNNPRFKKRYRFDHILLPDGRYAPVYVRSTAAEALRKNDLHFLNAQ